MRLPPSCMPADIALPAVRGVYGSGVVERLGPSNVFVAVVEFDPADAGTGLFAAPRPEALLPEYFSPDGLQRGFRDKPERSSSSANTGAPSASTS